MSSPQPNHEARALSTQAAPTSSERANAVRYRRPQAHVESLFLKGNSPDGRRALWIKYTILAPRAAPERARAELWAVAFRAGPGARPPVAAKQSFPLREASWSEAPFRLRLPGGELEHGAARGALSAAGTRLRWELRYACPEREFRPFPGARMYDGPFPRTKTLTPVPDTQLHGFFEVDGERWSVDGWAAAQGHNWGRGHAHAYAWTHCNAFVARAGSAPCASAWLEAIAGRVRLGPIVTPWLSCAAICVDGALYRFDGARALLSRAVAVDARGSAAQPATDARGSAPPPATDARGSAPPPATYARGSAPQPATGARSYHFELVQAGARLRARIEAEAGQIAGLRYEDPDGRQLACLNSKLAVAEVTLTAGGQTWALQSDRAALEIGTRNGDHGVAILV